MVTWVLFVPQFVKEVMTVHVWRVTLLVKTVVLGMKRWGMKLVRKASSICENKKTYALISTAEATLFVYVIHEIQQHVFRFASWLTAL